MKSSLLRWFARENWGYYAGFFALGAGIASLGPMLPALAARLGQPPETLGYFFSARSLGYLLGASGIGLLYDRLPGHRLLAVMLALFLVSIGLPGNIQGVYWMVIIIFFSGVALGGLDVGSNTLLTWKHKAQVGPFLNLMFFFGGLGSALAPLLVARLLPLGGIVSASWGVGLLAIPALVWLWAAPSPPLPHLSKDQGPVQVNWRDVSTFGVLFFIFVGLEVSFAGWIFTYSLAMQPADLSLAPLINSAFYQAVTVGRLLAVPLAARFSPRTLVLVNITGVLASLGLLSAWHSSAGIWMGSLGLGLSLASMFPSVFALTGRRVAISGRVSSLLWAFGSAGAILLPWLVGEAMGRLGPAFLGPVLLGLVILCLAIFSALWLTRRPRLA